MAGKESSLWKMCLVLTVISIAAAAGLAAVYEVTKKPIEESQNRKRAEAINKVLPGFTGMTETVKVMPPTGKDSVTLNMAYADGQLFGAAVETYTDKGFGGAFTLMVGFDSEGKILGTEVLSASETPGLGDKINADKSDFSKQFAGKNPAEFQLKVKKDGGDVDAITAATISSRAYCDAVDRAYQSFMKAKEESHE